MNNASKFIIFIVLCLAIWWGYDNFFGKKVEIPDFLNKNQEILNPEVEIDKEKKPEERQEEPENTAYVYVYMLTTDKSGGQFLKPVKRPLSAGQDKLRGAVKLLLEGPNNTETSKGIYTEVPANAGLISITTAEDRVTINLTSSFGTGGGSDSTYARMRQLIKTVLANTNKPVYLQFDGKQVDVVGGEGITVTQPLSEKSLDE